jgi:hypothetical protein
LAKITGYLFFRPIPLGGSDGFLHIALSITHDRNAFNGGRGPARRDVRNSRRL